MSNTRSSGMHIKVNPEIKASVEPILSAIPFELSSIQLTENGYTTDFEAELLSVSDESYVAVANGAKVYKNAAELE